MDIGFRVYLDPPPPRKVCGMIAFWAILRVFGLLFSHFWGSGGRLEFRASGLGWGFRV